jgi:hypothetical protein
VARLRVDHRQQEQLQVVRAEFAAAWETVAVAAEAARATAEAPAAVAAAAWVVVAANRVPWRVRREVVMAVRAEVAGVGREAAVVAAARGVAVKLVRVAWVVFGAWVAFTSSTMFAPAAGFLAGKLGALVPALSAALERLPAGALAVTAFESGVAARSAMPLLAGQRVPEFVERRVVQAGGETIVRAARTEKTVLMSHSGHSREYLKMCLKIYI